VGPQEQLPVGKEQTKTGTTATTVVEVVEVVVVILAELVVQPMAGMKVLIVEQMAKI
jgi:hypothetical protein